MADAWLLRSLLFLPADRLDRLPKAVGSGADAVILDLEDGVGPQAKAAARAGALGVCAEDRAGDRGGVIALRPNAPATEAGLHDLLALRRAARLPDLILLPKVESAAEIELVQAHLARPGHAPRIVALVESARGLAAAEAIAAHPAVAGLALGGADLAADLGAELAWEPLLFARGRLVQAAATAGIPAFDVPFLDIADPDGLGREAAAVRALGFAGKLAIHPAQIAPIHAAFTPGEAELARARRIVGAFAAAAGGVCVADGRMVDLPVVRAARRTVTRAGIAEELR